MKITIERAALLKTLAHVQNVVERRNTIPILSNVLLEGDRGLLSLTATDMDLTIVEEVAAQVDRAGVATAPAHTLYDIVRKLPDGAQIVIETAGDQGSLTLSCGRSRFQLQTLPKDDFPTLGDDDLPHSFNLASGAIRSVIERTRFAISTEETRYYLNGIYIHATKNGTLPRLRAVATDGHRLARVEIALPEGAAGMPGVIVPRKTVTELHKLLDEVDEEVEVALSETKIRFRFASLTLTSKLIDGTFPDYERVIPSGNTKVLEVNCREFTEAVDRVSTIATEKSRAVKLALSGRTLTLSANSPDSGQAQEAIDVDYEAEPIEIGFNSRYLLDITGQIGGQGAQFRMADAASPTIVADTADDSALYVLMPMRV